MGSLTPVFLTVTLEYMVPQVGEAAKAEALQRYHDDVPADVDLGVTAELDGD